MANIEKLVGSESPLEIGQKINEIIDNSGKSGFSLFDTKLADHILEGDEAKGWALQGTYVSGSLYPDFYNKVAEEFGNGSNVDMTTKWVQPVATADTTTITGGDMEITSSSAYSTTYSAYKVMDGDAESGGWRSVAKETLGWWQVKFPYKIKVKGLTFVSSDSATYSAKDCQFFTSADMTTPIGNAFLGSASTFTATEVLGIPAEGVITDTIYLNITSSNSTAIGMGELIIEAEKYEFSFLRNANGHQFYDIADKSVIDDWYERYGVADFCGVDTANKRVLLPRDDLKLKRHLVRKKEATSSSPEWYNLYSDGWLEQGCLTASSGQTTLPLPFRDTDYTVVITSLTSTVYQDTSTNIVKISEDTVNVHKHGNRVCSLFACGYANVPTEPTTRNAFLYYCVGNTLVNSSKIDAGALVAEVNTLVTEKANADLSNCTKPYIVESYKNGTSWYFVRSDGWIAQGGVTVCSDSGTVVNLLKAFSTLDYVVVATDNGGGANSIEVSVGNKTVSTVKIRNLGSRSTNWYACGY